MGVNQLITTNLAAFATFENERLKQCKRIQATKKKNGKYLGRRTMIDKKLFRTWFKRVFKLVHKP